jgi:mTERF domain-containing protein
MFRHALHAVEPLNKEKIAAKVEVLKKTFRWSDAEVGIAVSKLPSVLLRSTEALQSRSEFLISSWGWNRHTLLIGRQCSLITWRVVSDLATMS